MKVYDAAAIRNVALVGHTGSGKTQLASAILFVAGTLNRFGKVDEGTTVTDYDEEEIARKHTLAASLAFAEWNKQKINLIDTPGMGNFLSDARAALQVADAALVVVDAVSGVDGADGKGLGDRRRPGPAAPRRAEPPRPRAREPRALAAVAARRVQPRRSCRSSCRSARKVTSAAWSTSSRARRSCSRRTRAASSRKSSAGGHDRRPSTRRAKRSSKWSPKPTTS